MAEQQAYIKFYFELGLSHSEILSSLAQTNGIVISMRTLRRRLKERRLYRRKFQSDILDVALFIMQEVQNSGQLHGYRFMHLKCIQKGYVVSHETVRLLLKIIDPDGVTCRKRRRLRRRQYFNEGPNFMWHVDSYDKLKPYGICINGAIDGFSRYVLWLEAHKTNSDPRVIANYFLETISERGGCPKRLRVDLGTENGHMTQMQEFMRYDQHDAFARRSCIKGSSTHNQRIESFWGMARRQNAQYWMNLFQGLKDRDLFIGDFLDKNLIQFCFMNIIQNELDELVNLWNHHRIRPVRNAVAPHGRPFTMYALPHLYGATDHICDVTDQQVELCAEECIPKGPHPCDSTVFELCNLLMQENDHNAPSDGEEAVQLYCMLRLAIHAGL